MFQFLIAVRPLGLLYGSAGAFLSPENLVGRSGTKFPPDAATLSGLILATNQEKPFVDDHHDLKLQLTVAGAFWAEKYDDPQNFYVPIPQSRIIDETKIDEWEIREGEWCRQKPDEDIEASYTWQRIRSWEKRIDLVKNNNVAKVPWTFVPILHPTLEEEQRHVRTPIDDDDRGSLFLENAVQMQEDSCLVYLSTHRLPDGWYRFGGESHLVEIKSEELDSETIKLLEKPIKKSFALICPAVWGTNNQSWRYPKDKNFSNERPKMLTNRPVPFRYRIGKKLGIGRYAVPAGTVYVVKHPLEEQNNTWWKFPHEWFPQSQAQKSVNDRALPLKYLGCGLCLPIEIKGVD
ncbi:MAG: CRISPR-associated protein [Oscillatoriales cyanobacterium RM2_1_1]|nr:CRISPR-associated protein [Oscillatoriales cyanobacterium SM2_3_0]NJO47160.1 CRISPR-associated protein [Oscillatoriales cyanobacterium RM2_1_1]